MNCPNCGNVISDENTYCTNCGFKKEVQQFNNNIFSNSLCTNCGNPINPDSQFCSVCGLKIENQQIPSNSLGNISNNCPNCGTPIGPNEAFCSNCGYKIDSQQVSNNVVNSTPSSSLCPTCGNPILPDSAFCVYCGGKVDSSVVSSTLSGNLNKNVVSNNYANTNTSGVNNKNATTAFTLAMISLFCLWFLAIPGIVLAEKAKKEIEVSGENGMGLAKAAEIISVITLILVVIRFVITFVLNYNS